MSHASGNFVKLNNVFDVVHRNFQAYYSGNSDERLEIFFKILMNRDKSSEECAEVLLNGVVCIVELGSCYDINGNKYYKDSISNFVK